LKLLKNRNFAVCCFLMLLTGGLLNATTVLLPQFMEAQLGYTATLAGFALSGGGVALLIVMPFAGQAVSRFPARNLIMLGFVCFTLAFYYTATHLNINLSFGEASWIRILQIGSIPFVFISVTTAAYFGMPRDKSNQISGLINFVRNIGGSILIALTNAGVTQLGQFNQNIYLKHLVPAGRVYQQVEGMYQSTFGQANGSANAKHFADGQILNQMQAQATTLAYVDMFWVLCAASAVMIPLAFLLQKNDPTNQAKQEIAAH
jgi:DHA2 family multidrug resistance protein